MSAGAFPALDLVTPNQIFHYAHKFPDPNYKRQFQASDYVIGLVALSALCLFANTLVASATGIGCAVAVVYSELMSITRPGIDKQEIFSSLFYTTITYAAAVGLTVLLPELNLLPVGALMTMNFGARVAAMIHPTKEGATRAAHAIAIVVLIVLSTQIGAIGATAVAGLSASLGVATITSTALVALFTKAIVIGSGLSSAYHHYTEIERIPPPRTKPTQFKNLEEWSQHCPQPGAPSAEVKSWIAEGYDFIRTCMHKTDFPANMKCTVAERPYEFQAWCILGYLVVRYQEEPADAQDDALLNLLGYAIQWKGTPRGDTDTSALDDGTSDTSALDEHTRQRNLKLYWMFLCDHYHTNDLQEICEHFIRSGIATKEQFISKVLGGNAALMEPGATLLRGPMHKLQDFHSPIAKQQDSEKYYEGSYDYADGLYWEGPYTSPVDQEVEGEEGGEA